MRRQILLAAILFVATAGFASGEHSASPCQADVIAIDANKTALYLVVDEDGEVWLYAETNAHPDLQRGGARWHEMGTGIPPPRPCWDIDLTTGEQIPDPDVILF